MTVKAGVKKRTLKNFLLILLAVQALAACIYSACGGINDGDGEAERSATPAAAETAAAKSQPVQKSVNFTLSSAGDGQWKVYNAAAGGSPLAGVSASFTPPVLTLTASGDDLAERTYYVTVTEPGKTESGRLALTVEAYSLPLAIPLKPASAPMLHVGGLHTAEDFNRIKTKLTANEEPWVSGYAKLTANSHAQSAYNPGPVAQIVRGGTGENYSRAFNDAAAAYQLALRWKISGDPVFAARGVYILNEWAKICTEVTGDTNQSLAAGLYGYQFAVAAELLRDYGGWSPSDFSAFKQWMLDVFFPKNLDFLTRHHDTWDDHYWANWDLCNLASVLAIGILTDRRDIYNIAVRYLQTGIGNGNFSKFVNYIHITGAEELGQLQESGRDQGHATLCIALMDLICRLTWNQGDDFYGFDDNRFLKGCEYTAKYNVANLDVPFQRYVRLWGNKKSYPTPLQETHTVISSSGRGTVRPMWAGPYYHYAKVKGLEESKLRYTKMGVDATAPEGGGGDYGSASGGFDQLGFGTLMYTQ
ncbi:MAG: alginate lyase family protein [Treponema sp.]|jgi:hypothetical protein|nr:alginate lyase family protein [Treponema sp.]